MAAFANAQRGQVFGALYERDAAQWARLGDELVMAPETFVAEAAEMAEGGSIAWVSTDAECVTSSDAWKAREALEERVECVSSVRAPMIGRIGLAELARGRFTDALALDANYVRRPDAEIFWKGRAAHGR